MASKIDLDKMSPAELTGLIDMAQEALKVRKEGARVALVEEMRSKAAALGLDLSALITTPRPNVRRPRSDAGKSVAAKYRSQSGETWSGRGRQPKWFSDAIASGKTKDEFRV